MHTQLSYRTVLTPPYAKLDPPSNSDMPEWTLSYKGCQQDQSIAVCGISTILLILFKMAAGIAIKMGFCLLLMGIFEWRFGACQDAGVGNGVKQEDNCPCVQLPGSKDCKPYDPHYQALTLEEAVLHFHDPTNLQGDQPLLSETVQDSKNPKPACDTPECTCCTLAVLDKIRQSLSYQMDAKDVNTASFLNSTEKNLKKRNGKGIDCRKYMAQCHINSANGQISANEKRPPRFRAIRQNSLGSSTQLSCNYRRGGAMSDGSNYVGLCNLCWSIRTLPSNYFPRFINELTCDSDTRCLSGWGTCRERTRSVDVMINGGSDAYPRWNQVSINSPVACECQIMSGSALHNLVSA